MAGDGFEVERYAVSLRPDLVTTAGAGAETIVVWGTGDGVARLAFSANALRSGAGTFSFYDAGGAGASFAEAFARTPAMAAFFASKAGLPLPDGRYAQVLTPEREAQEVAGFSLIGHEELDRERDDLGGAWVMAERGSRDLHGGGVEGA